MLVQYDVKTNGELLVRDESLRTIILHDAYWMIKCVPEEEKHTGLYGMYPNSPKLEIPDRLFDGLYYIIRRWHKSTVSIKWIDGPDGQALKKHIETLESELVKILKMDGRISLESYLFHKKGNVG